MKIFLLYIKQAFGPGKEADAASAMVRYPDEEA